MKQLNIYFILSITFYISIISKCFKISCLGERHTGPCYLYMSPYGKTFEFKVLKELFKYSLVIYNKVENMIRKSCTCPQKLMEANNYIRNNVPQSTISKICYKLNIYTKCLPKTYLMLSPKPKDKKRCRKFVGLFRRNSNVGNLEPRMPQLRRLSLKLF